MPVNWNVQTKFTSSTILPVFKLRIFRNVGNHRLMTKNSVHNENGDGGDVILGGVAGGRVLFCRLASNSVCSSNCPKWTFDSPFSASLVLGLQTRWEILCLANEFHIFFWKSRTWKYIILEPRSLHHVFDELYQTYFPYHLSTFIEHCF